MLENVTNYFNPKKEEFNSLNLDKNIKQRDIKLLYSEATDYIIINKWNNINTPSIIEDIIKDDNDKDIDGIDNKYRLSSIYKKDGDLDIKDDIEKQITFNGYYYKLDACIITNNDDDINSQLITCLTNDYTKYIYIGNKCPDLHEFDWLKKDFSIYSVFPCDLFKPKKDISDEEKKKISVFNIKKGSNYTLIYVKSENIQEQKARDKAEQKEKEARDKAEQKEQKEKEAKDKAEK
jgi:hypothetical protein